MTRLLPLLLIVGCTQTARVTTPAVAECMAVCTPGGGCTTTFKMVDESGVDSSILMGNTQDTGVKNEQRTTVQPAK